MEVYFQGFEQFLEVAKQGGSYSLSLVDLLRVVQSKVHSSFFAMSLGAQLMVVARSINELLIYVRLFATSFTNPIQ